MTIPFRQTPAKILSALVSSAHVYLLAQPFLSDLVSGVSHPLVPVILFFRTILLLLSERRTREWAGTTPLPHALEPGWGRDFRVLVSNAPPRMAEAVLHDPAALTKQCTSSHGRWTCEVEK